MRICSIEGRGATRRSTGMTELAGARGSVFLGIGTMHKMLQQLALLSHRDRLDAVADAELSEQATQVLLGSAYGQ